MNLIEAKQKLEEIGWKCVAEPDDDHMISYFLFVMQEGCDTYEVEIDIDDDDYILHSHEVNGDRDYFGHEIPTPYGLSGKELELFRVVAESYLKEVTE